MNLINNYEYTNGCLVRNKKSIELTKTQAKLISVLSEKEIATFNDIENNVYKNKNFSKATLRNCVKNIRNKTCYELIKSDSKIGYGLNKES